MTGIVINFETEFHEEIKEYCKINGYSINGLVRVLLRKKIDEEK